MRILTNTKYKLSLDHWRKYRTIYNAGDPFVREYLKTFSSYEDAESFKVRKSITPIPAFATAAIDKIKNSIYSRLVDVSRLGGSESYINAVAGKFGGVDQEWSTMTNFIGCKVLLELLVVGKVGVYVDSPRLHGETLQDNQGKKPYVYIYRTEDIVDWQWDCTNEYRRLKRVVLRDNPIVLDPEIAQYLINNDLQRFREYTAHDGYIECHIKDIDNKEKIAKDEKIIIDIPEIPLIIADTGLSLLRNIGSYQVALLNLTSSDMNYGFRSNVPVYVEQYDPKWMPFGRNQPEGVIDEDDPKRRTGAGEDITAKKANNKEIAVGSSRGRRYPIGTNAPQFINPSPDPLRVSMEKQEQLKREIFELIDLNANNVTKMASAESKDRDNMGLESGLSAIGLHLETIERRIADYWAMYEGSEPAEVKYPRSYRLKSEAERRKEAEELNEQKYKVPSPTFAKIINKKIADVLVGHNATADEMAQIVKEIEDSKGHTSDYEIISSDVENGLLSHETASQLRGYAKDESVKAADEHAKRLATIQAYQTQGARGVPDNGDPKDGKREKEKSRETDEDDVVKDKTRGEGK